MTLHQPWHDGVGRRVGKRLRHIRRPKKPPDPRPSVKEWKHAKRMKKKSEKPVVVEITKSMRDNLTSFHDAQSDTELVGAVGHHVPRNTDRAVNSIEDGMHKLTGKPPAGDRA